MRKNRYSRAVYRNQSVNTTFISHKKYLNKTTINRDTEKTNRNYKDIFTSNTNNKFVSKNASRKIDVETKSNKTFRNYRRYLNKFERNKERLKNQKQKFLSSKDRIINRKKKIKKSSVNEKNSEKTKRKKGRFFKYLKKKKRKFIYKKARKLTRETFNSFVSDSYNEEAKKNIRRISQSIKYSKRTVRSTKYTYKLAKNIGKKTGKVVSKAYNDKLKKFSVDKKEKFIISNVKKTNKFIYEGRKKKINLVKKNKKLLKWKKFKKKNVLIKNKKKNVVINASKKILSKLIRIITTALSKTLLFLSPFGLIVIVTIIVLLLLNGGSEDDIKEDNNLTIPINSGRGAPVEIDPKEDIEKYVTSYYGYRDNPTNPYAGKEFHNGIDIAMSLNTPILATHSGTVKIHNYGDSGYGKIVYINTDGMETRYAHLNNFNVKDGDNVKRGDVIGFMGTTGRSTGVHLHYELWINDKRVDPLPYIKNIINREINVDISKLPERVLRWEKAVEKELKKYNLESYKGLILTIIKLESDGNSEETPDIMQSSESIGLSPNTISNPYRSIEVGVKFFNDLILKRQKEKVDILTMIHSYNYGLNFMEYVRKNGGEWSQELANSYSDMWQKKLGWPRYGDKQYVKKALRYFNANEISY